MILRGYLFFQFFIKSNLISNLKLFIVSFKKKLKYLIFLIEKSNMMVFF